MKEIPYYKQGAIYSCALACLRMVLDAIGRKFSEYELTIMTNFNYTHGISMPMMADLCRLLGLEFDLLVDGNLQKLLDFLKRGFCTIVLVNPGIMYFSAESKHGHYIIVKHLADEKLIINDPDSEYGGENKEINLEKFLKAWRSPKDRKWMLVIRGEENVVRS